jgi:hypothetical protein
MKEQEDAINIYKYAMEHKDIHIHLFLSLKSCTITLKKGEHDKAKRIINNLRFITCGAFLCEILVSCADLITGQILGDSGTENIM